MTSSRYSARLFGLDGIPLTEPKTGVGHYTFELACALAALAPGDEFELTYPSTYSTFAFDDATGESSIPLNLRACAVPVGIFGRHWWSTGLPAYVKRRGFQLFHGTNFDVPLWNRCPTVLTLHDLSTFLHAATHEARRVRRARRRLPVMLRVATMIITPTETVRREVCEQVKIDPAKVVAVPEAPRRVFRPLAIEETRETRRRLGLDADLPYLLAVGTIEPRKNLITLVRAFEAMVREFAGVTTSNTVLKDLRLVVAGNKGWLNREFFAHVSTSAVRERIHFTGYVSDDALRGLYSSCAAFIYPSLYEGFGLPPLEAMACGAPVIASRISAHVETLGAAACLFEPGDVDALARRITEVAGHQEARLKLSTAGQKRAAQFTWERTAQLTLEVYEEVIRNQR